MSDAAPQRSPQLPQLEGSSDLEPVYVNLVRIAHTPSEMLLDFARILPGNKKAQILAQVMMSPLSAKLFQRALSENLAKYEAAFGVITVPGDKSLAEYSKLFRPSKSPEDPSEE